MSGKSVEPLLVGVFARWDADLVSYLILRNHDGLPTSVRNDVDVLVAPRQMGAAKSALFAAAASTGWTVANVAEFACTAIYLYHPETRCHLHVDLMPGPKWHSLLFADTAGLLAARRPCRGFFVADPSHEAAVNLMTRLLYRGVVPEKYRPAIREVARSDGMALHRTLRPWVGERLAQRFVAWSAAGDWPMVERSAESARSRVFAANLRSPAATMGRFLSDLRRGARRWLRPPGVSVVLVGPDGCGKSSVARGLRDALRGLFHPDKALHCHWKPWPAGSTRNPSVDPHGRPPRGRPWSIAFFAYHVAGFVWGWWRFVRPALFRNGLVTIDRYYYDFFVDLIRYRLTLRQCWVRWAYRIVPRPDIVLCLDAPVDTLRARKQELSDTECQRQRDSYRDLVLRLPNGVLVDASQPLDAVVGDAERAIIARLESRAVRRCERLRKCGAHSVLQ